MVIVSRMLGKVEAPNRAYLNPKSGVTYSGGISGIDPTDLNVIASLISNNAEIDNTTQTVYVDYNDAHYKVDTGNTITINVSSKDYAFRIIGFNHDDLTATAYGEATATGKAGITFQMVDCLDTKYQMNSSTNTNEGGWKSCAMRSTHLPSIKSTIAAAWTGIIKKVNKKTSAGSQSSTINTVSDDLFLLSEIEIFGSTSYSFAGEGDVYAYWSANNTASARVKKVNGSANGWWGRSPISGNTNSFCYVNNDGNTDDYGAIGPNGVSFGFCV